MAVQASIPSQALKIDAEMRGVWESLPLGGRAKDASYDVTQEAVDRYLDAVGGPANSDEAAGWVPPDIFCADYAPLTIDFGQTIGFHASHRMRSFRPMTSAGGKVHASGKITDKFQRRGFRYFTLTFEHRDDAGQVLVENETTIAVGVLRDPNYKAPPRTAEAAPAPRPEPGYQRVGEIIFTQDSMGLFAEQGARRWGWDYTGGGSHTDEHFAQSAGLERTNAQSLHYYGWLARYLAQRWDTRWWTAGNLDMKFVGQVGPDDLLVAEMAEEDDGLTLRIRHDKAGGVVSIGRAWLSPGGV